MNWQITQGECGLLGLYGVVAFQYVNKWVTLMPVGVLVLTYLLL